MFTWLVLMDEIATRTFSGGTSAAGIGRLATTLTIHTTHSRKTIFFI
jgi:hypothetical protein